jgi:hypothetical protein
MDSDDVLKAELEKARAECERLREENTKLRLRVVEHNGKPASKPPVRAPQINGATQTPATVRTDSPPELKVSLFMSTAVDQFEIGTVNPNSFNIS